MNMVRIEGNDLRSLLSQLGVVDPDSTGIRYIRIDQRGNAVAVKVNEDMWSPSIGVKQEAY